MRIGGEHHPEPYRVQPRGRGCTRPVRVGVGQKQMMNKVIVFGFVATLLAVGGCASPAPKRDGPTISSQQRADFASHAEGSFSQLNPHYKDRAGVFYDIRYVSPSAEALFKIADIRPDQMRKTVEILRLFVDEWLGVYVEGNGSISPEEINMCVRTMDERFDALLDDLQRKQYRIWRDDTTGDHNKLRFLMSCPPTRQGSDAQQ